MTAQQPRPQASRKVGGRGTLSSGIMDPWTAKTSSSPASQEHLRELRKAIDAWRAEDAAKRPPRETLAGNVARLYPDGAPAGLVPVRLVPVEVFGSDCDCHGDRDLAADGTDCVGFSYGLSDAVSAYSDCNRAIGRIYRRDEDESKRDVGDTILVWVAPEHAALFDVVFGER